MVNGILVYKIALSRYNLRLLYYIKKELGVGSVNKDNLKGQFVIRDRKKLANVIFPIFDKYPLLISKLFDYIKSKKPFYLSKDLINHQRNFTSNFSLRNYSTNSNNINPIVVYLNADTLKLQVIKGLFS